MAIGAELYADEEAALDDGSRQPDLWGINLSDDPVTSGSNSTR